MGICHFKEGVGTAVGVDFAAAGIVPPTRVPSAAEKPASAEEHFMIPQEIVSLVVSQAFFRSCSWARSQVSGSTIAGTARSDLEGAPEIKEGHLAEAPVPRTRASVAASGRRIVTGIGPSHVKEKPASKREAHRSFILPVPLALKSRREDRAMFTKAQGLS
jgi:hypothetical protein